MSGVVRSFPRDDRWGWVLGTLLVAFGIAAGWVGIDDLTGPDRDVLGGVVMAGSAVLVFAWCGFLAPARMRVDDETLSWGYLLRPPVRWPLADVVAIRQDRWRGTVVVDVHGHRRGVLGLPGFADFAREIQQRRPGIDVDVRDTRREVPTGRLMLGAAAYGLLVGLMQWGFSGLVGDEAAKFVGALAAALVLLAVLWIRKKLRG